MRALVLLGAVLAFLATAGPARAGVGGFFPNDRTTDVAAATSASGVTTQVWAERVPGGWVVMGRRTGADGTPLGEPVRLSAPEPARGFAAKTGVDPAGNAIVVMLRLGLSSGDLAGVRWAADGTVGAIQPIATGVLAQSLVLDVGNGPTPTATFAWATTGSAIRAARWTVAASAPSAPVDVSAAGAHASNPVVAAGSTSAVIAWEVSPDPGITRQTVEALRWPVGAAPGAEHAVSAASGEIGALSVGADDAGDAVLAYGAAPSGAAASDGVTYSQLRAARWPAGAAVPAASVLASATGDTGVAKTNRLAGDSSDHSPSPSVEVRPGGGALIVWGAIHGCAISTCAANVPGATADLRSVSLSTADAVGTERTLTPPASAAFAGAELATATDAAGVTTVAFGTSGVISRPVVLRIAADDSVGTAHVLDSVSSDYAGMGLGVAASGTVTATWAHPLVCDGDIRTSVWPSAAAAPQAPALVSSVQSSQVAPTVWGSAGGAAVIAEDACQGGGSQPRLRPWPAGGQPGAPIGLGSPGAEVQGAPVFAVDATGRATLAWVELAGTQLQLRAVRISPDGTPGAAQTLSAPGSEPNQPAVAVTPGGDATIVWDAFTGTHNTVYGTRWPVAGAPAPPTALSPNASVALPDDADPAVAVDPAGTATIAWNQVTTIVGDATALVASQSGQGSDIHLQMRRWTAAGGLSGVFTSPASYANLSGVVVGPSGDATIATDGPALTGATTAWPAGASAPLPAKEIGTSSIISRPVIDAAGDVFIPAAYSYPAGGQGRDTGLFVRPAGADAFSGPFDASPADAFFAVATADAPGDVAVSSVTFTNADPDNDVGQVVVRRRDGTICPVQTLGAVGTNFSIPKVAPLSADAGVAVWGRFDGENDQLQSARITSGCAGPPSDPPVTTPPGRGVVPPPTGGKPPAGVPASAALACTKAQAVLVNVLVVGHRVRITGAARPVLAGKRITIRLTATKKKVAAPKIAADGTFRATVPLPSRKVRASGRARYKGTVGKVKTAALKLTRRADLLTVKRSGKKVRVAGRVTGAFVKGTKVTIGLRVTCSRYQRVARVKLTGKGTFSALVAAPAAAGKEIAVYRATTTVLTRGRREPTATLPQPVG